MNVRTSTLASLVLFLVIPACSTAPDDGSGDDATDTTSADLSVCKTSKCGPALEMPTLICSDGSLGGNTGRCIRTKGTCHWEIRECPPAPTPPPPVPPKLDCSAPGACGPALGMPNYLCDDGKTVAGPTGNCLDKGGVCGWEVISCPVPPPPPACKSDADCPGLASAICKPCADGSCEQNRCVNGSCQLACAAPAPNCGKSTCSAKQTCCSGMPFAEPTCVDGTMCPISQRKMKKDIHYLTAAEREQLNDELMDFRLATYRYKTEGAEEREHLGFIIDDVAPSPAVLASGERVDMYGYSTMTVAALQTQARQIAALQKQIDDMKKDCAKKR